MTSYVIWNQDFAVTEREGRSHSSQHNTTVRANNEREIILCAADVYLISCPHSSKKCHQTARNTWIVVKYCSWYGCASTMQRLPNYLKQRPWLAVALATTASTLALTVTQTSQLDDEERLPKYVH
jgi:hypothetical protein